MKVVVSLEHRFERTPDGAVWTQTQYPYPFWVPYLRVFDSVRVVARVKETERPAAGWTRADGDGVVFAPIPYYIGPCRRAASPGPVREPRSRAPAPAAGPLPPWRWQRRRPSPPPPAA